MQEKEKENPKLILKRRNPSYWSPPSYSGP